MARIVYLEIAGKQYPLSFSLMAQKKIAERYGSLGQIADHVTGDTPESYKELAYLGALLIQQGCAYKNYFEKDVPPDENAAVADGKYIPLTEEELAIAIGPDNIEEFTKTLYSSMGKGQETEVEILEKNEDAPEGTKA